MSCQWLSEASWYGSTSEPGALGGTEQLLLDKRSSSGETPQVAMALSSVPLFLTLGGDRVPETTTPIVEQLEELQGKIVSILCYEAPQGRLSGAGEGFSPMVSHA